MNHIIQLRQICRWSSAYNVDLDSEQRLGSRDGLVYRGNAVSPDILLSDVGMCNRWRPYNL